jgi:hypothetical protein
MNKGWHTKQTPISCKRILLDLLNEKNPHNKNWLIFHKTFSGFISAELFLGGKLHFWQISYLQKICIYYLYLL